MIDSWADCRQAQSRASSLRGVGRCTPASHRGACRMHNIQYRFARHVTRRSSARLPPAMTYTKSRPTPCRNDDASNLCTKIEEGGGKEEVRAGDAIADHLVPTWAVGFGSPVGACSSGSWPSARLPIAASTSEVSTSARYSPGVVDHTVHHSTGSCPWSWHCAMEVASPGSGSSWRLGCVVRY